VARILKQRYGAALLDLQPSEASQSWLYGDSLSAKDRLASFRQELFGDSNFSPEVAEALTEFSAKAHACAMQMLENASYIEQELPKIKITEESLHQIQQVCSALVGTKHDVISELSDLEDLDLLPGANEVQIKVRRLMSWMAEELPKLHGLVQTLEGRCGQGKGDDLAFLLVAESATHIMKAFSEMGDAAQRYLSLCSDR